MSIKGKEGGGGEAPSCARNEMLFHLRLLNTLIIFDPRVACCYHFSTTGNGENSKDNFK